MSSTLTDFADVEPLTVREMKPVHHPTRDEIIGFIGPSNRDANCVVCQRKRHRFYNEETDREEQQFYRKNGGYSISESTLGKLRQVGVNRVVIEETDNDRILEFDLRDYEQGLVVNERDDDPQRNVPVDDAVYSWTASEVTIIRDHE